MKINTYIAGTIITDHKVDQRYEQVLDILATTVSKVGTERVQND